MDSTDHGSRKRRRSLRATEFVELLPRVESGRLNEALSSLKDGQHKASAACDTCRTKKVKCNEGWPQCSYCSRHGFKCDYPKQRRLSHDKPVALLLERLIQAEQRLDQLERLCDDREGLSKGRWSGPDAPNTAYPSPFESSPQSHFWTEQPGSGASLHSRSATSVRAVSNDYRSEATTIVGENLSFLVKDAQYLGKTPLACEEQRPPLPDILSRPEPSEASNIMSTMQEFQDEVCTLYPVICDSTLGKLSGLVNVHGFQEDLHSCFVLLMVALTKAHKSDASVESGLSDFEWAMQLRGRLGAQLTLEYVQIHVLCTLFLLKKGRLIDFSLGLNACCNILHTLIKRDRVSGLGRPDNEKNTIRLLFWICYNLERDVTNEIDDSLPRSPLSQFEDMFQLPLPCEEPPNKKMTARVRHTFTFFLAEMSLRAVLDRIVTTPDLENCVQETSVHNSCVGGIKFSPLIQELRSQLDTWILRLPTDFFNWSIEPGGGMLSSVGTRLKLLYWFARFSLMRPLMLRTLQDSSLQSHFLLWEPFREGLLPALTMVKVFIVEQPDVDVLMANRIVSVIDVLKQTTSRTASPVFNGENMDHISRLGMDLLLRKLGNYSEWTMCKVHNMQR